MGDKIGTLLMMNELEFFAICPVKKVSVWSDYTVHWIFLFSSTNLRLHILHTSKLVHIAHTWQFSFRKIFHNIGSSILKKSAKLYSS